MERRRDRARIADVAREAAVSKTAVSFAFNRPERLAGETADRILRVADTLGYRPHPVASMLARRHTMTIGVLTPRSLAETFANPFFSLFSEGVAGAAEEHGYELHFISPLQGSLALAVGRATVDGVIALGLSGGHPEVGQIRSAGLPMVLVDSDDLPEHSSIVIDDEDGACAAANYLLELGHRNVVVLAVERPEPMDAGPRRSRRAVGHTGRGGTGSSRAETGAGVVERRLHGYRRAFDAAGIPLPADWIVASPASIEGGAEAFRGACARGLRPTGVLAMSDGIAIGAMSAARELGRRVPADLSVVGFDDIDLAAHVDPPLTTVHQPSRRKGAEAVRLLLEAIEHGEAAIPEHLRLETRLAIRGSTGPVPTAARSSPARVARAATAETSA